MSSGRLQDGSGSASNADAAATGRWFDSADYDELVILLDLYCRAHRWGIAATSGAYRGPGRYEIRILIEGPYDG